MIDERSKNQGIDLGELPIHQCKKMRKKRFKKATDQKCYRKFETKN